MATYSGAWRRATLGTPQVTLVPGRDPQHAATEGNPEGPTGWHSTVSAPLLPDELYGGIPVQGPTVSTLADHTPRDHEGERVSYDARDLTTAREVTNSNDTGAVAERAYRPTPSRDGEYHALIVDDQPTDPVNPETRDIQYTQGVGAENDPGARIGKRVLRWRERVIDNHWFTPGYRPSVARTAYTAPDRGPAPGGDRIVPQSPLVALFGNSGIGSPVQFVWPEERRSPRPWGESGMTDQSVSPDGLSSWGL